jgi:hypothetical protein
VEKTSKIKPQETLRISIDDAGPFFQKYQEEKHKKYQGTVKLILLRRMTSSMSEKNNIIM